QGFLPLKEWPQVHNPNTGWVATANHNILPPGYKQPISYEWSPSYRYERIKQRLEGKKQFTLEDFQSIQHDNTSLPGQALVQLLKAAEIKDRELQPFIDQLAGWDGELSISSRPGALYAAWLQELLAGFYGPQVPEKLLEFTTTRGVPVLLAALEKPDKNWFG